MSDRHPGGRPSKLTPQVANRIVAAIRAGNYMQAAAEHAGVNPATVYRWLADADRPRARRELREFREAVMRARADCEVGMVATVVKAARGGALIRRTTRRYRDGSEDVEEQYAPPDGRVALEFLARAYPARWARRTSIEVGSSDDDAARPAPDRITVLATRVRRALEGGDPDDDVIEGELAE
jgi:AcrR family transcriptional regulator